MANVFDYIAWRGDLPFSADPFNAVDNIIFSILSYYPFEGIVSGAFEKEPVPLPKALKKLDAKIKTNPALTRQFTLGEEQRDFLSVLAETERYRSCTLYAYISEIDIGKEMQFAALTVITPDLPAYVSFRGTDTTIIGWKEDFNMSFSDTVPAQEESVKYLNKVSKHIKHRINTGGHSKGGNLAVYAASFCDKSVQKRINRIYSNDAPGFTKLVISSDYFNRIKDRIESYIPRGSVIGLLFEHIRDYKVVQSSESGLMQHNPFSWEVRGKDMVYLDSVTPRSSLVNKTLMEWYDNMDNETLKLFTESLFDILRKTNITSIPDFNDNALKNTVLIIKTLNTVDKKTKTMLLKTISALFETAKNNFQQSLKNKMNDRLV